MKMWGNEGPGRSGYYLLIHSSYHTFIQVWVEGRGGLRSRAHAKGLFWGEGREAGNLKGKEDLRVKMRLIFRDFDILRTF
jgi:hypothetical protein